MLIGQCNTLEFHSPKQVLLMTVLVFQCAHEVVLHEKQSADVFYHVTACN